MAFPQCTVLAGADTSLNCGCRVPHGEHTNSIEYRGRDRAGVQSNGTEYRGRDRAGVQGNVRSRGTRANVFNQHNT